MASQQRQTALAFLDTFENLDLESNLSFRTDDCRHTMAPESMGYGPEKTNEEFAEHFKGIAQLVGAFPVTPKEIFEHEGSNQITIWATGEAIFRDGVKDGDPSVDWSYHGEYMFVFVLNEDGTKIKRLIEFIDSKNVAAVQPLLARAKRNLDSSRKTS